MAELVEEGGAKRWDRFSDLSDHIVYHIFFFLEFDDIARVGVVSKRCRQLFVCSPYLKLRSLCAYISDRQPKCERFSDSMNSLLNLRNGSELRSLCLHWLCYIGKCNLKVDLCYKWITFALGCGLQELDLQFGKSAHGYGNYGEIVEFEMPHGAFNSNLLRVLKLHLNGNRLKAPAGVFPSLEELSLRRMGISGSNLEIWVSTACPSLKRLNVENLYVIGGNMMTIVNPCIEELTLVLGYRIETIDISAEKLLKLSVDMDITHAGVEMKINAPNINDLSWNTTSHCNISLNEFIHLQKATIFVDVEVNFIGHLVELLNSICHVRELQINIDSLEFLFVNNLLNFDGENLVHLSVTIDNRLKSCHFTVLALFLMGSPKLETLFIKCKDIKQHQHDYAQELKWKAAQYYNEHDGFESLNLHQLNEIEIEIEGKGHRLGLVENMLKIPKGLKKLTILYPRESGRMVQKFGSLSSESNHLPLDVHLIPR